MGLNDLLEPPTTAAADAISTPRTFHSTIQNNKSTPGLKTEFATPAVPARQNPNQSQANAQSPSDYAYSPPLSSLDTSAIDPSLLPSPQAQGQAYAQGVQATYAQNPYQELQFPLQNAPGMDFLQGNGWEVQGDGNAAGGNSWTGDLGMGLGWEGLEGMGHDFSEGGNGGLDLFDGFFFGGTGGY
jgi:hypothetical protein